MDPVTHTLVGATMARAGLKHKTPLATATLILGANLPDIDVAAYAFGSTFALTFRRGWTHGALALVVLPFVLTGLVMGWDRFSRRRRQRNPIVPTQILLLATVAILSHPLLDFLNVYGMRWLMPFDDRWFYGDVLFIVDPILWVLLTWGAVAEVRRPTPNARRARGALAFAMAYVLIMTVSSISARQIVDRAVRAEGSAPVAIMAGPVPINPFRRWVVVDEGDAYRVGDFNWFGRPALEYGTFPRIRKADAHDAVARVRDSEEGGMFLRWARFPFFIVTSGQMGYRVDIVDARYALEADVSFGAISVEVEAR